MKAWKRLGAVVLAVLTIAALTGTALAAEPVTTAAPAISVQMNGEALTFSDAVPEAVDGRTFVPLYAVTEALGAEVNYAPATKTITIQRNGADLSMVLGENKATVVEDGQTRTITMDVIPYAKNNRTYVPIAFVADALGCGVGWDQSTRTVIIADVDALLGDATFDLMDNFSAYCTKQQASKNMTMTGTLDLNIADKSGAMLTKPVTAKGSIDGVTSDTGLQMSWDLKLSGLSDLAGAAGTDPMMQGIVSALSDLKGEVRMDLETMELYLSLPGVLTGGSGEVWYSVDLSDYWAELLSGMNMTQLTQLQEAGIRDILAAVIQSMPLTDSEYSYASVAEVVEIYTRLLSDQAFTQQGNAYVAQMKLEDMVDMTVTLTKKGEDVVAADIKMNCDVSEDGEKVTMTMTEHAAPDKVTVDMDMSVEDSDVSVNLTLDMNCVPTTKAPVTTLPAGVQAVPMS